MTTAALRELLSRATLGPWRCGRDGDDFFALFTQDGEYAFGYRDDGDEEDNAALAAAAVNTLPALLDVAEAAADFMGHAASVGEHPCIVTPPCGDCRICRLDAALAKLGAL